MIFPITEHVAKRDGYTSDNPLCYLRWHEKFYSNKSCKLYINNLKSPLGGLIESNLFCIPLMVCV